MTDFISRAGLVSKLRRDFRKCCEDCDERGCARDCLDCIINYGIMSYENTEHDVDALQEVIAKMDATDERVSIIGTFPLAERILETDVNRKRRNEQ